MKAVSLLILAPVYCAASRPLFLFEENRGQAAETVRYLVRTPAMQVYLTDVETRVSLKETAISIVLEGSGLHSRWRPDGPAAEMLTDHIHGADPSRWRYGIPNFRSVRRADVYPGIDQIYYANSKRLEYDFEVKPLADPTVIRLQYSTPLTVDKDGSLVAGKLIQHAPVAYQTDARGQRQIVQARWELAGSHTARFVLGSYDRKRALVIDPEIEAAAAIGGPGADEWTGLTRINGALVAVGVSETLDYPGALGRGRQDISIVLLNPATLQPVRAVFIGGSGTDRPLTAGPGRSTTVRVAGETDSRDFPAVGSRQFVPQPAYGGGQSDGFVLDYDFFAPGGSSQGLVASTYFGGSGADRVTAVSPTRIAGETRSDDLPAITSGPRHKAGWDVFSATIPNGISGAYADLLLGSGDERAAGIATVDNLTVVFGSTDSPDLPVQNAWQSRLAGRRDGFIWTVTAPSGSKPITTYWGGSGDDEISGVAGLGDARILIAGTTSSRDLPMRNAAQPSHGGGASDAFLSRFNAESGVLLNSTYLGGSGVDTAAGLTLQAGAVYLAGTTGSTDLAARGTGQTAYGGGASDAYLAGFRADPDREELPLQSLQYVGGSGADTAFALTGIVLGINSDSPPGDWSGHVPLQAPGAVDGFLFALSERRIQVPASDFSVGKDQSLDTSFRLGGSTSIQNGIPVTITSSDPALLQVSFSVDGPAAAEDRVIARTRDVNFTVHALAASGDVRVTIRAEGYADESVRFRLVPIEWQWRRSNGTVVTTLGLPLPTATAYFSEGVSIREGYVIPGTNLATYPGRTPRAPSAGFRFRSTNPEAVEVTSTGQFGVNAASIRRVGPGEAQIIAEATGAAAPPLTVTTIDPPVSPATGGPLSATVPNGARATIPLRTVIPGVPARVRVADPSLVRIFDPFLEELVEQMDLEQASVEVVALADEGTTELVVTSNGQDTAILLNLVPAEVSLQNDQYLTSAATVSRQSPERQLGLATNFAFDRLWEVSTVTLEAESSDSSVIEVTSPRVKWVRGGSLSGVIRVRPAGLGSAEVTLRVVEGPANLRTMPFRFLVEDAALLLSGSTTVGKNLASVLTLSSSAQIPSGTVFTVESSDPTLLSVENTRITYNSFPLTFRVIGLAGQGTATVKVSAPGWPSLETAIQLAPSAVVFAQPDGPGFDLQESTYQLLRISAYTGISQGASIGAFALNSRGEPMLRQAPAIPVNVRITSENPDIVTSPPPASLPGSPFATFNGLREGKTRLILDAGPQWTPSSLGNALDVEVLPRVYTATAGPAMARDTQVPYNLPFDATGQWTIRSSDPTRLLVSASAASPGSESVTVNAGESRQVFLQALAGSGSVALQVTTPGADVLGTPTVQLREMEARLSWAAGNSVPVPPPASPQLTLSLNSPPASLGLTLVPLLFPSDFAAQFGLRPGVEHRFPLQVQNREVALLTRDAFVVNSNSPAEPAGVRAVSPGRTEVRVAIPPQFIHPGTLTALPVLVEGPALRLPATVILGEDLMREVRVDFANIESQANVSLTVESSDPSRVLVSPAAGEPGQPAVSITVRPGSAISVFVHALVGEGAAAIRARASGYGEATSEVRLRQAGLTLTLPSIARDSPFAEVNGTGDYQGTLSVRILPLLSDSFPSSGNQGLAVRPGANWDVTVRSSDPGVVEVLNPKPVFTDGIAPLRLRAHQPGRAEVTAGAGDLPVAGIRRIRVAGRASLLQAPAAIAGR